MVIYPELKKEFLKNDFDQTLVTTFENWVKAWGTKDIDTYIGTYSKSFSFNGMSLSKYRDYKNGLNKKYSEIKVAAENVRYNYHPKYHVVTFVQNYASKLASGGQGFQSLGTKMLYFVKEDGAYKIINESYTNLH